MNKLTIKIKFKWLKYKNKNILPLIDVDEKALKYFRKMVKGNKDNSYELLILKINRDFYSGKLLPNRLKYIKNTITKGYGCLRISYDKKLNKIVYINNNREHDSINIDNRMKSKFETLYEIDYFKRENKDDYVYNRGIKAIKSNL